MKDIKIGLIGAGWMGKAHTNAFKNAVMLFGEGNGKPIFEFVADVNTKMAENAQKQLGYNRWTDNWKKVVTDDNVDLVDIATPNVFHYEVAKEALLNGKHVYCEKPLTLTPEQSKELADLAKEKGVVNFVGFNNVHNPATSYIKELVVEGKLGEIVRFTGTYDQDALNDKNLPITWRHLRKFAGSGALGDLGSHLLSVAQYIMGDIVRVNAISKTVFDKRPNSENLNELIEVENEDLMLNVNYGRI